MMNEINKINILSSKIRESIKTISFIQKEIVLLKEYKDKNKELSKSKKRK